MKNFVLVDSYSGMVWAQENADTALDAVKQHECANNYAFNTTDYYEINRRAAHNGQDGYHVYINSTDKEFVADEYDLVELLCEYDCFIVAEREKNHELFNNYDLD